MAYQGVKFTKATYTDLLLPMPTVIRPVDVHAARVGQVTDGNAFYEYGYGIKTLTIALMYDQTSPMPWRNLFDNFNLATGAQTAGTQSLFNWYLNAALGGFGAVIGPVTYTTVYMLNTPGLGFEPVPDSDNMYSGRILLRVEY